MIESLALGNSRFAKGLQFPEDKYAVGLREQTTLLGGKPKAIVVGCSDSRTSPEVIFQAQLGEIFVVRSAGLALDSNCIASVEIGVAHFGIQLIIVMGHTRCRAIELAQEDFEIGGLAGKLIKQLRKPVTQAMIVNPDLEGDALRFEIGRHNSRFAAKQLIDHSTAIEQEWLEKRIDVVPAFYTMLNGKVEFLEPL